MGYSLDEQNDRMRKSAESVSESESWLKSRKKIIYLLKSKNSRSENKSKTSKL